MSEPDPALRPILVLPTLPPCHEGVHPALGKKLLVCLRDRERVRERNLTVHGSNLRESAPDRYGKGSARPVIFEETRHHARNFSGPSIRMAGQTETQ